MRTTRLAMPAPACAAGALAACLSLGMISCSSSWQPHPTRAHVLTNGDGGAMPAPGYRWSSGGSLQVEWGGPGQRHPQHEHLVSGAQPDTWYPRAGFTWEDPHDPRNMNVLWLGAGQQHPTAAHVQSGREPGTWAPAPGWTWAEPSNPHSLAVRPSR